ncbi:MAG: hypothetical protein DMG57_10825 [Acidobacteria bacterium]|nr:MAG: hypothetical protein DMG57_10825 [Acidobacteriota bacterium]
MGNAGAEAAFGSREFGANEGLGHILYHNIIQDKKGKQAQKHNTNLLFARIQAKTTMGSDVLAS